jgi:phage terminase Nu1 subunit (DNA packaging protein)
MGKMTEIDKINVKLEILESYNRDNSDIVSLVAAIRVALESVPSIRSLRNLPDDITKECDEMLRDIAAALEGKP